MLDTFLSADLEMIICGQSVCYLTFFLSANLFSIWSKPLTELVFQCSMKTGVPRAVDPALTYLKSLNTPLRLVRPAVPFHPTQTGTLPQRPSGAAH